MFEQTDFTEPRQDIIAGRNSITEALKSGREIEALLVAKGERSGSAGVIVAKCRDRGIPVKEVSPKKLDFLCANANHQGMVLMIGAHTYSTVDDILASAESKNQPPFVIICEGLEDPHNLGAVIRTAEAAGAHGIIIPKRGSAGLTYATAKAACGALEYMPVARVSNIAQTIELLKHKGLWIYGADMSGQPWTSQDLSGALAIVIGGEGSGLGRLIKEKCDILLSLPMKGKINSLNASVAGGILMYEVARQRG